MIEVTLEQALTNIDGGLATINANRQTHEVLKTSVQRVRDEIASLTQQLQASKELYAKLVESIPASAHPASVAE